MGERTLRADVAMKSPVRRVWPLVSHTDLVNRLAGLAPVDYDPRPGDDGSVRLFARTRMGGLEARYEESCFDWTHGQGFEVDRVYESGPVRRLTTRLTVTPEVEDDWDDSGCRVAVAITLEAPGLVLPIAAWSTGKVLRSFEALYRGFDRALLGGAEPAELLAAPETLDERPEPLDLLVRARIERGIELTRERLDSPLLEKLQRVLEERPEAALHQLRPYALAREWGAGRRETLELCLAAAEAGLLTMRWDVICPHCRGDPANLAHLADATEEGFCHACNLRFDVDLSRSLEAVFTPHAGVRPVEAAHFCLAGPGANPHVFVRRQLEADETARLELRLPAGRYRLRVQGLDDSRWVEVGEGPRSEQHLVVRADRLEGEDLRLAADAPSDVAVENATGRAVRLEIETADWLADALPASELFTVQRFRDVFSAEALSPGVRLSVERVAILFTDLVASTAMYQQLGDARAFRLVWRHFDGLQEAVDQAGGAVIKTIGDAVMAAFASTADAARAAMAMQAAVDAHTAELESEWGATLKIGLADGPALAVTLNDRLDYFGSTVNLAARVQGASAGGDILVARETLEHLGGAVLFEEAGWNGTALEVEAKGFDEPVAVVRFARPAR